jgi:DEAD/DEAH box helicase domain-containing protein
LGSRAASLSSVAVSHLFHSPFHGSGGAAGTGDERKLLAFTDSVQDASHRAGFFAGRTYRFNLRTAMQSTLVQAGGELPLSDLAPRMLEDWSERLGEARMVATFMPPDLREHADYVAYLDAAEGRGTVSAKKRNAVMKVLRERLSWEVTREYGYGVTVGRTLEGTVCSTLTVEDQRMEAATRGLTAYLEEHRLLQRPGGPLEEPEVRHFLEGLVRRLRMRGGVFHPLLSAYAKTGNRFLLSKRKNPHFSPFGPQSVAPRFLYDGVQHNVFDTLQAPTNRKTWWRDWTSRSLKCKPQDAGIGLVLEQAFERLAIQGVVRAVPSGKSRAFGLEPAALRVTSRVQQAHCTVCNSTATLPAAALPSGSTGPATTTSAARATTRPRPRGLMLAPMQTATTTARSTGRAACTASSRASTRACWSGRCARPSRSRSRRATARTRPTCSRARPRSRWASTSVTSRRSCCARCRRWPPTTCSAWAGPGAARATRWS